VQLFFNTQSFVPAATAADDDDDWTGTFNAGANDGSLDNDAYPSGVADIGTFDTAVDQAVALVAAAVSEPSAAIALATATAFAPATAPAPATKTAPARKRDKKSHHLTRCRACGHTRLFRNYIRYHMTGKCETLPSEIAQGFPRKQRLASSMSMLLWENRLG